MFCTQCGTRSENGWKFCKSCGSSLPESGGAAASPPDAIVSPASQVAAPISNPSISAAQPRQKLQADLSGAPKIAFLSGGWTLPKAFWIAGVLGSTVLGLGFSAIAGTSKSSDSIATIFFLAFAAQIFLYVGIWNSADNYAGSSVWKFLAKTWVVLGSALNTLILVTLSYL